MKTELFWLALTTIMTGLMWVPYVLDRIAVRVLRPPRKPIATGQTTYRLGEPTYCSRTTTRSKIWSYSESLCPHPRCPCDLDAIHSDGLHGLFLGAARLRSDLRDGDSGIAYACVYDWLPRPGCIGAIDLPADRNLK